MNETITPNAKARYTQLKSTRDTILQRGRKNSELTIPGLVPGEAQDSNTSFSQPYQSLGARCVNNLASWLLLSLFPPDQPFARISIHEDTAAELGESLEDVKLALGRISSKAHLLVETAAMRPMFMETLRHLIVAGNALLYVSLDGAVRMYRIDQYVVLRDERGRAIELVIEEKIYPSTLSEETRAACDVVVKPGEENEKQIALYTHAKVDGEDMVHYQEINGKLVPKSEGRAKRDQAGWLALRWQAVPGSDYGRAHVTEYIGDLMSLEDISKAIIEFAAVASRIIHIVDPNSGLDVEELAEAESGEFITGYIDKVKALQLDKSTDFTVASTVAERLELRLSHAFLLQSGTVRNAERVTAEEIRAMAQELENVLGGVYTVLSAEFQLPLIRRLLWILVKNGDAPELPKDVQPTIVTGFEALGRNHAANKIRNWLTDMNALFGPQAVASIVKPVEISKRLADNYGIEGVGSLVKTEEDLMQEQQQAATQQAMMAAAPAVAQEGAKAMMAPEPGLQG